MPEQGSRADRLAALVAKVAPDAKKEHDTTQQWPVKISERNNVDGHQKKLDEGVVTLADGETPEQHMHAFKQSRRAAPYEIEFVGDGTRIKLYGDDGSVTIGAGGTIEEALAALEAKF